MKTLRFKLLEIQREIGAIKKDSTNPFFKSKYFDINALLAQLKPMLNAQGLLLTQSLTTLESGKMGLKTAITNCALEEEATTGMIEDKIEDICPIPDCADPQKYGSAITYFRRYALTSLLALEAEDNDGNDLVEEAPNTYINDDLDL